MLEAQPAAGALQLLAALVPPARDERPEHPAVALGRGLLEPLLAVYDSPRPPAAELAPPSVLPTVSGSVAVHCVRGNVRAASASRAVCGLLLRLLEDLYESGYQRPDGGLGSGAGDVAAGLMLRVAPAAGPGAIRVRAELTASVAASGLARTKQRGLRARIEIDRAGGWLAGGPDPARPADVLRHPSLRRATIELELPLESGEPASARLILHEAVALGVHRTRWVISYTDLAEDAPLLPEARVVVGRLAAALGPLPDGGPVRQLVDLLAALGVTEPGTSQTTGGAVALSIDGIQRLLVDPRDLLAEADASRLAAALAAFLGAPAPAAGVPTRFAAEVDGVRLHADLAARTLEVETAGAGLELAAGVGAAGHVTLAADGVRDGELSLAFGAGESPSGRPVLALAGSPPRLVLRLEGAGRGLPGEVELFPSPDVAGLHRLVATAAPAGALWAGITFLRGLEPGVVALIDPLLRATGLLVGSGEDERLVVPVGMLADPASWLTHPSLLAGPDGSLDQAALTDLLDAAAALLGVGGAEPGSLELPYGIRLGPTTVEGRTALRLGIEDPVGGTGLRVTGGVAVAPGVPGGPPRVRAELATALAGATPIASAGRVELAVGASGLTARLRVPAHGVDISLIPPGAGLASLAGAAAEAAIRALPFVLDAIAALPAAHPAHPVGVAVGALGDALGLRPSGGFDGEQLEQLAADPGPQLAQRLEANLADGLDALRDLVAPALPTGVTLTRSGNDLVLAKAAPAVGVRLDTAGHRRHPARRPSRSLGRRAAPVRRGDPGRRPDARCLGDRLRARQLRGRSVERPRARPGAARAARRDRLRDRGGRAAAGGGLRPRRRPRRARRAALRAASDLRPRGGGRNARRGLRRAARADRDRRRARHRRGGGPAGEGGPRRGDDQAAARRRRLRRRRLRPRACSTPTQVFDRVLRLAANVAERAPSLPIDPLTVRITARDLAGDDVYGVAACRCRRPDGCGWSTARSPPTSRSTPHGSATGARPPASSSSCCGSAAAAPSAFFGLEIRGVGLRFGRSSGPLLDTVVAADSVALHGLFGGRRHRRVGAGGQLELTNLRLPVASAPGRQQPNRAGLMRDTATGAEQPKPAFSPALAVQKRTAPASRSTCAPATATGRGVVAIQKGFGPLYLEQVGFGVDEAERPGRSTRCCSTARCRCSASPPRSTTWRSPTSSSNPGDLLRSAQLGGRPRRARGRGRHRRPQHLPAAC